MINLIHEGDSFKSGLNIRTPYKWYKWPWIAFIWVSIDLSTYTGTSYYFRIRSRFYPFLLWDKSTWNIVDNYLFISGKKLITREQYTDYVEKYI